MKNDGYTLVELMVSMLITAVVITIVISFMSANSSTYNHVSENVNLQIEAQSVMNQISDMILEAEWIQAKDIDSNRKAIIIYNQVNADVVLLDKSAKKLYYIEALSDSDLTDIASIPYDEKDNLMGSHVSDISFYPKDKDSILYNGHICLSVDFTAGTQTCHEERNVKFRNKLKER